MIGSFLNNFCHYFQPFSSVRRAYFNFELLIQILTEYSLIFDFICMNERRPLSSFNFISRKFLQTFFYTSNNFYRIIFFMMLSPIKTAVDRSMLEQPTKNLWMVTPKSVRNKTVGGRNLDLECGNSCDFIIPVLNSNEEQHIPTEGASSETVILTIYLSVEASNHISLHRMLPDALLIVFFSALNFSSVVFAFLFYFLKRQVVQLKMQLQSITPTIFHGYTSHHSMNQIRKWNPLSLLSEVNNNERGGSIPLLPPWLSFLFLVILWHQSSRGQAGKAMF